MPIFPFVSFILLAGHLEEYMFINYCEGDNDGWLADACLSSDYGFVESLSLLLLEYMSFVLS
jgi:hypothetical protein